MTSDEVSQGPSLFGIYVHLPWCRRKCPYCDFNVYVARTIPEQEYAQALRRELEHYAWREPFAGLEVSSLFFGGGTPSLFHPDTIGRLIDCVTELWGSEPREVTLEANPGTLDAAALAALLRAGVTRLSLGVQSFHDHVLRTLVRDHTAEEAERAVAEALDAGFLNVNVDLIFAVPGQSEAEWEHDLEEAVRLGATGISAYGLTWEEGTAFRRMRDRGRLQPVGEEVEERMYVAAYRRLTAAGYAPYEISNYARPGFESRHNLACWLGGQYLGVGCGAHSYASRPGWGKRWSNERRPETYMARVAGTGQARAFEESLDERQARWETAFLALRTARGLSEEAFQSRFGVLPQQSFPALAELAEHGLLELVDGSWRLTLRGRLLSDSVFTELGR